MIKINVKKVIDLFDSKKDDFCHDISSVINLIGEDLGASLFKRYYESEQDGKVTISQSQVLGVISNGKQARLDRWIFVTDKSKNIAFQTEIKNWSAYAIGARCVGIDKNKFPGIALLNWKERLNNLSRTEINRENKVLAQMKPPKDLPPKADIKPLIIYWYMLSNDGKSLDPFFEINLKRNGFEKLYVFSISNYLRSIKNRELTLDMPNAEKRIKILNKYFLAV